MAAKDYEPAVIEKKWQDIWEKEGAFRATSDKSKPKYYTLIEFPYPSGEDCTWDIPQQHGSRHNRAEEEDGGL